MQLLRSDLILLHAPSVYDFRKKAILYGPISDVIPSSPVFEMYPIGFSSLLEYLHQRGMRVRIINLAYLMLTQKDFDAENVIRKVKCTGFGMCAYETGRPIKEIDVAEDGLIVTAGGRVLNVTAIASAYAGVKRIEFDGALARHDIGRRALTARN